MDDLIAFLRARLDEREARANAAAEKQGGLAWRAWPVVGSAPRVFRVRSVDAHRPIAETGDVAGDDETDTVGILDGEHVAEFIADNDPARVHADVAAKRQIADMAERAWTRRRSSEDTDNRYDLYGVVGLLAEPYADHPDYREEWRP